MENPVRLTSIKFRNYKFSDVKIAENFRVDELPLELAQLLSDLEVFTRSF